MTSPPLADVLKRDLSFVVKERDLQVHYLAKDYRRRFRVHSNMLVQEAIALCVQRMSCPDRDYDLAPSEQYGLYNPQTSQWVDASRGNDLFSVSDGDELQLLNRLHAEGNIRLHQQAVQSIKRKNASEDPSVVVCSKNHYAEGWLLKKSPHASAQWQSRFFLLVNHTLYYYKKQPENLYEEPQGQIDLGTSFEFGTTPSVSIPISSDDVKRSMAHYGFHLTKPHRTYQLCASNAADLAHWLRILRQLQAELQDMLLSDGTDDEEFSSKIFEPAAASLAGLPGGDKAGYLLKRGRSTNIWKGRWFVLKDKVLQYYKGKKAKGYINLEGTQIFSYGSGSGSRRMHTFKIVATHRSFFLKASDQHQFDDWSKAFEFVSGIPVTLRALSSLAASTLGDDDDEADDAIVGGGDGDDEGEDDHDNDDHNGKTRSSSAIVIPSVNAGSKATAFEGFLMKQGNNVIADWRRRYCILNGTTLFYKKLPDTEGMLGSIPLCACVLVVEPINKTKKPFSFELDVSKRQYFFQAQSEVDRNEWVSRLRPLVSQVL